MVSFLFCPFSSNVKKYFQVRWMKIPWPKLASSDVCQEKRSDCGYLNADSFGIH
jgi:hypothetical protein